jgi:hypothetical protein
MRAARNARSSTAERTEIGALRITWERPVSYEQLVSRRCERLGAAALGPA